MSFHIMGSATLGSAANTITISNIYNNPDIEIVFLHLHLRSDIAATAGTAGIRFNSDTGTNYAYLYRNGNTVKTSTSPNITGPITLSTTYAGLFSIPGSTASTNTFSTFRAHLYNYNDSSYFKNLVITGGYEYNGTAGFHTDVSAVWLSTNNITSISLINTDGNFVSGSKVALYGLGKG